MRGLKEEVIIHKMGKNIMIATMTITKYWKNFIALTFIASLLPQAS